LDFEGSCQNIKKQSCYVNVIAGVLLLSVLSGCPDIAVGGFRFYCDSFFFFIIFRQVPNELTERNSTKTGHMLRSEYDLKMHVQNVRYPLPLKIWDPKTTFSRLRNLPANSTAYIFGTKHDIDSKWSPTSFQNFMYFGPQTT